MYFVKDSLGARRILNHVCCNYTEYLMFLHSFSDRKKSIPFFPFPSGLNDLRHDLKAFSVSITQCNTNH